MRSAWRFSPRRREPSPRSIIRDRHHPRYGEEHGTPYIVTELVDGSDRAYAVGRRERARDSPSDRIGSQVAEALAAAHGAGITHRDVKPETSSSRARAGRAARLRPGTGAGERRESEAKRGRLLLTEAGTVFGTPAYMSPEQVRGEGLDSRSDIFGLGVVLSEMTIRRPAVQSDRHLRTWSAPFYAQTRRRCQSRPFPPRFDSSSNAACANGRTNDSSRRPISRVSLSSLAARPSAIREAAARSGPRALAHRSIATSIAAVAVLLARPLSAGDRGQSGRCRSAAAIRDRGARRKSAGLVAGWAQHRVHVGG